MYKKGSRFERELKEILEKNGYAVIRSAGSKGVDIIAGKKGRYLIFECKTTSKDKLYINKEDIIKLIAFSEKFGGIPYLAVKIQKTIIIIDPYNLKTDKKSYVIDKNITSLTIRDIL